MHIETAAQKFDGQKIVATRRGQKKQALEENSSEMNHGNNEVISEAISSL